MKINHFFIVVVLFFTSLVSAQTEIKIDFKARTAPTPLPNLNQGDFYKITVTGINPNLYKIVINSKDTLVNSPLKMPTFADIDVSSFAGGAGASAPVPANAQVFYETVSRGVVVTSQRNASADPVVTQLNAHLALADKDQKKFLELVDKLEKIKFELYKQKIDQLSPTPTTNAYDGVAGLQKFIDLRAEVNTLITSIKTNTDAYSAFLDSDDTEKFLKKNPGYKTKTDGLTKLFEKLATKSQELLEAISADNAEKFIKSVMYLDGKSKTFTSLPIQFSQEKATVTLQFQPRDSTITVQEEKMVFSFPLTRKDYWSIGTSFYYSNLGQDRYSYTTTTVNDKPLYTVVEQEKIDREFGISVMLRGGLKFYKDWFGGHLAIGPGMSINDAPKPRVLFGAGFSFGRKHSFTIDFGGIAGFVDKKANGYTVGSSYDNKPDNLTVSKLKIANFISVGYMFRI